MTSSVIDEKLLECIFVPEKLDSCCEGHEANRTYLDIRFCF